MANTGPDPGPSTNPAAEDIAEPVFKKRAIKRGTVLRPRSISADPVGEAGTSDKDGANAAAKDTDAAQSEDQDEFGTPVADLLALRALQRKPAGIELDKLNKGERKKRKKKGKKDNQTEEEKWQEQMAQGGLVTKSMGAEHEDEDEEEDEGDNKTRKLVRQNNFQGETNTVDVDKHMMAYIEEEMRKRRGAADGSADGDDGAPTTAKIQQAINDPEDELYRVAEKYRQMQQKPPAEEGNVTLSAAMLTSIPEIDLGMDARLKNIEETEKAKRDLFEERKAQRGQNKEEEWFAAERFFRPRHQTQSDHEALKSARLAADGQLPTSSSSGGNRGGRSGGGGRREMASDEMVMERFKKRQRNNFK